MSSQPPRSRRIGLRILITLVLFAFLIVALVFVVSQPVSAPGEATPEADSGFEILFMSDRDGDWDIYAAAGREVTNLTQNDAADGFGSYSTDLAQISYVSSAAGEELGGFLMNADGSGQTPATADITTFMNILLNGRGDWDLRGTTQAATLISLRDLNLEVYYAVGDTQTNLTANGAIDWYAQLSPDGTRIAFASDRVDVQHDIYVIDVTGENLRQLTDDPANDWSPLWIDDNTLLFASERDQRFEGSALGLYMVEASGEGIPAAQPAEGFLRAGYIMNAAGTHTLEMRNDTGDWEIYVTAQDGTLTNVTNDAGNDMFPVWK